MGNATETNAKTNEPEQLAMAKCPFCGGDATLKKRIALFKDNGLRIDWSIECENCYKADGGKSYRTWYEVTDDELLKKLNPEKDDDVPDGRLKVITAWNRRAAAEEPAKEPEKEPSKDVPSTDQPSKDQPSEEGETKQPGSGEGGGQDSGGASEQEQQQEQQQEQAGPPSGEEQPPGG